MEKTIEEIFQEICDGINFYGKEHRKFFMETLLKLREIDVYHIALTYTLGISKDTREHIENLYDFKEMQIKPEGLFEGWQTSGSQRVTRLAFNLYTNGTPSVEDEQEPEEQLTECSKYAVEDIFCCGYAPYFWQAVKLRYPEYC